MLESKKTRCGRILSLWKGPYVDGITQSMLNLFFMCRERFRLRVVEGLAIADSFRHALEYGNMWHLCEEHGDDWENALQEYALKLCKKHREQQPQIHHWTRICAMQYPLYLKYWKQHGRSSKQKILLRETTFAVPYQLDRKRQVILRGKWDQVSLDGSVLTLRDHKTKGDINEENIQKQLTFDLQTMFYTVALQQYMRSSGDDWAENHRIEAIEYNVVRRPLGGGRGTIRQRKDETVEQFYSRLEGIIKDDPSYYFMRWTATITEQDIERFRRNTLDHALLAVADWWDALQEHEDPFTCPLHFRTPYGLWNPLAIGATTAVDAYLLSGSMLGLEKDVALFQELADGNCEEATE